MVLFCTVKQCCCCSDLRTGSKIIGFVWLVTSILSIIQLCVVKEDSGVPGGGPSWYVISVLIADAVAGFLLLYGIYRDRKCAIFVYLVYSACYLVLRTFANAIILSSKEHESTTSLVISVIAAFVLFALHLYFWVVVYSYYVKGDNAESTHSERTGGST